MQPEQRQTWTRAITVGAAGAVLLAHCFITLLHLLPANPFTVRYQGLISAYISPAFAQSWRLFAPDPPYESRSLLVACRLEAEQGALEERPPVDVTTELRALQARVRITPATYLLRAQMGPLAMLQPMRDDLERRVQDAKEVPGLDKAREDYARVRKRHQEAGQRMMARVASSECRRLYPGRTVTDVRPLLVLESVPKYSQRHLASPPTRRQAKDLGWMASVPPRAPRGSP